MLGLSTRRLALRAAGLRQSRYRQLALLFFAMLALLTFAGGPVSYAAPNAVTWPIINPQPFAAGFSSPIDIESANDGTGRLFVLEQQGLIYIIDHGTRLTKPF